jgi:hypothetical protein
METQNNDIYPKKEWKSPDLFCLDVSKTESGDGISNFEDGTYHPDSQA